MEMVPKVPRPSKSYRTGSLTARAWRQGLVLAFLHPCVQIHFALWQPENEQKCGADQLQQPQEFAELLVSWIIFLGLSLFLPHSGTKR